jgi:hypothetical protein
MKIGRNDPCPCGSGKKHKKCCLEKGADYWMVDDELTDDEVMVFDPDFDRFTGQHQAVPVMNAPEHGIREFDEFMEFNSSIEEINAADRKLAPHHAEFVRLITENQGALFDRSAELFAEPSFDFHRFTKKELSKVLKTLGPLTDLSSSEERVNYSIRATKMMTNELEQRLIACRLMCLLPKYVAEERYMDACIIKNSAMMLFDSEEEDVVPFLIHKFIAAMKQWNRDREKGPLPLFQEMGINLTEFEDKTIKEFAEIVEVLENKGCDMDRFERFMESHPELCVEAEAALEEMEEAAFDLLESEEGEALLLSAEEIFPWLEVLNDRLEQETKLMKHLLKANGPSEKGITKFTHILYQLSSEMAAQIFTKKRLDKQKRKIRKIRDHVPSENHKTLKGLNAALIFMDSSMPANDNHFLVSLCFHSVKTLIESMQS